VTPQVPPSWPGLSIERLRVGGGAISVAASREGERYTTTVDASLGWALALGATLPAAARVASVTLDGAPSRYEAVDTARDLVARAGGDPSAAGR
jgi:hypothetical protein